MSGPSSHEFVDHTSEIVLRLRAASYPDLLVEAAAAFAALAPERLKGEADPVPRELRIEADDRAGGLVVWLNELVYLAEAERWLPFDVTAETEVDGRTRLRAHGVTLLEPFVLVKAATLHDLAVREEQEGLVAEVTLDV